MIRPLLKKTGEAILGAKALAPLFTHRTSGCDLILSYHNVVPPGEETFGDASLHIGFRDFLEQIAVAAATHEVVPLSRMLEDSQAKQSRVAISFDDAYGGVVDHALAELVRLGVPATVFLAPGLVGVGSFWWDALAASDDGILRDDVRDHALWKLGGEQHRIEKWARERGLEWIDMPEYSRCATLASVVKAASLPGIDFGSHTWSHPNLAAMDPEYAREELRKSRQWLLNHDLAGSDQLLAYPYGHENDAVRAIASDSGYVGGLKITGGWVRTRPHPFAIPRLNVASGLSIGGFRLRMRGLLS